MKANEFVKKHGWEAVIEAVSSTTSEETAYFESTDLDPILSKSGDTIGFNVKVHQIKYDEVKQLVKSWERVEKHGGINGAIEATGSYYIKPSEWEDLNNAITDVESCQ